MRVPRLEELTIDQSFIENISGNNLELLVRSVCAYNPVFKLKITDEIKYSVTCDMCYWIREFLPPLPL